jgi:hypothetical protein
VLRLTQKLESAQQNLELDMPEAACLAAQQAYTRLSEIRLELETIFAQWQLIYISAREYAQFLHHKAANCYQQSARDLDWKELPFSINVDVWVHGDLRRLQLTIEEWIAYLEENKHLLTVDKLREVKEIIFPDIDKELDELVYRARVNILNSQLRINIADMAVQALIGQGYFLYESSYISNNPGNGYYASLRNLEGSEICIQVEPIAEDIGQNELHLISLESAQKTTHEIRQSTAEITNALDKMGLRVGEMQIERDLPRNIKRRKKRESIQEVQTKVR